MPKLFRTLGRTPGFTAISILILALGIGLATSVFTVANTILVRQPPVLAPEEILGLWGRSEDGRFLNYPLTLDHARDFARDTRTLARVGYFGYEGAWPAPFRDGDRVLSLRLATVSGDVFDVLGARPVAGRGLVAEDNAPGAAPVAVLGYSAWRRLFNGDPEVVGRELPMHSTGLTYRVVGIMPEGLEYPGRVDIWAPLIPTRTAPGSTTTYAYVDLVGRLRPGASAMAAQEEISRSFERQRTDKTDQVIHGVATDFRTLLIGEVRPAVVAVSIAAALVLLVACINVAGLLLLRGLSRSQELAVRTAWRFARPRAATARRRECNPGRSRRRTGVPPGCRHSQCLRYLCAYAFP
jgi:putative ABC transport system permease protein